MNIKINLIYTFLLTIGLLCLESANTYAQKDNKTKAMYKQTKPIKPQFQCLIPESPYRYERFQLLESKAPTVTMNIDKGLVGTGLRPSFGDVDLDGDTDLIVHAHKGYYYFENNNKKLQLMSKTKANGHIKKNDQAASPLNAFEQLYAQLSKANKNPIDGVIDFVKLKSSTAAQDVFVDSYDIFHFKRIDKDKIDLKFTYSGFPFVGSGNRVVSRHLVDMNLDGVADLLESEYLTGSIQYTSLDNKNANKNRCKDNAPKDLNFVKKVSKILSKVSHDKPICNDANYASYSISGWITEEPSPCKRRPVNVPVNAVDIDSDGDMDIIAGKKAKLIFLENKGNLNQEEKMGACVATAFTRSKAKIFKNVHASERTSLHIQEAIDIMPRAKQIYIDYKKRTHKKGDGHPMLATFLSMAEERYYYGDNYDAIDFDFGDMDGDGDPDLVVGTLEGRLQFYENINGTFIRNGRFTLE